MQKRNMSTKLVFKTSSSRQTFREKRQTDLEIICDNKTTFNKNKDTKLQCKVILSYSIHDDDDDDEDGDELLKDEFDLKMTLECLLVFKVKFQLTSGNLFDILFDDYDYDGGGDDYYVLADNDNEIAIFCQ